MGTDHKLQRLLQPFAKEGFCNMFAGRSSKELRLVCNKGGVVVIPKYTFSGNKALSMIDKRKVRNVFLATEFFLFFIVL